MEVQGVYNKPRREGTCPAGAARVCAGCGGAIRDPVVLCVGPDQQWHAACLRCAECHCPLEGSASCFLKDGRTFCKGDYKRKFAVKCGGCREAVHPTDMVVKAGGHIYHPQCLRCAVCHRPLIPGDHFTLGPKGLCCQVEHTMADPQACTGGALLGTRARAAGGGGEVPSRCGERWESTRSRNRGVRARTVLSDAQLRALHSCYSRNPRPDALAKLQLGKLTGLSPRVVRVWFQNKRCKDKKKSLRGDHGTLGDLSSTIMLCATARPMVVLSPEIPDSALQICVYESPQQLTDDLLVQTQDHKDILLTQTISQVILDS